MLFKLTLKQEVPFVHPRRLEIRLVEVGLFASHPGPDQIPEYRRLLMVDPRSITCSAVHVSVSFSHVPGICCFFVFDAAPSPGDLLNDTRLTPFNYSCDS